MLETLFLVGFIAALTPGPDFFLVLRNTLCFGVLRGLVVLSGIATGWLIFLVIIYFGFTHFLQGNLVQCALSLLGGVYLCFLGKGLLTKPFDSKDTTKLEIDNSKRAGYLKGLMVNLSNPKAILFFGVLITPFLDKDLELSILVLLCGITSAFLLLIIVSGWIRGWITPQIFYGIDKICGILFVVFGVWLLWEGLRLLSGLMEISI